MRNPKSPCLFQYSVMVIHCWRGDNPHDSGNLPKTMGHILKPLVPQGLNFDPWKKQITMKIHQDLLAEDFECLHPAIDLARLFFLDTMQGAIRMSCPQNIVGILWPYSPTATLKEKSWTHGKHEGNIIYNILVTSWNRQWVHQWWA